LWSRVPGKKKRSVTVWSGICKKFVMARAAKAVSLAGKVSAGGKTFVDKDNKSWTVTNPEVLKGHEGHEVTLKAHEDAAKNEIHVVSVKMGKDMLEIVWRNPRPPRRTAVRVAGAWSREATTRRMRADFYRTSTAEIPFRRAESGRSGLCRSADYRGCKTYPFLRGQLGWRQGNNPCKREQKPCHGQARGRHGDFGEEQPQVSGIPERRGTCEASRAS
jgi:hypothetical protein